MKSNTDLVELRENYAKMGDDEILMFVKEEGLKLKADAFLIMREELKRRGIAEDILGAIEHEIILKASIDKQRVSDNLNDDLYNDALGFAFSQKEKGSSDYDIYVGLIEKGIDERHANIIVNKLDEWANKLVKDAIKEIQSGFVIMILGVIAIFVTIEIKHFEYAAIILLLGGIIRIVASSIKKGKSQKILENIKLEKESMKNLPFD